MNTFAVIGNVDAGKSTLIGVLKSGELDNGKGIARESIMRLKHEKQSGNTTNGNLIVINNDKDRVRLLDIAGHDKYFDNSMRAITEYNPSYGLLILSAVKGLEDTTANLEVISKTKINNGKVIQNMNKLYLNVCAILQLPVIVIITKIDNCNKDKVEKTRSEIASYLKEKFKYKMPTVVTKDNFTKISEDHNNSPTTYLPIFKISSVTGEGIDLLTNFLYKIEYRDPSIKSNMKLREFAVKEKFNNLFEIYNTYNVRGKGIIVDGKSKLGDFKPHDEFNIGPFSNGYIRIRIRSLHDDSRNEIDILKEGQYGCLCIKVVNSKDKVTKKMLRRSKVVTDHNKYYSEITCSTKIGHHKTTIDRKYKSYVHCNNIGDPMTILSAVNPSNKESEDGFPLRSGNTCIIRFRFKNNQFIYPGSKYLIREDNIKAYGIVSEIHEPGK